MNAYTLVVITFKTTLVGICLLSSSILQYCIPYWEKKSLVELLLTPSKRKKIDDENAESKFWKQVRQKQARIDKNVSHWNICKEFLSWKITEMTCMFYLNELNAPKLLKLRHAYIPPI